MHYESCRGENRRIDYFLHSAQTMFDPILLFLGKINGIDVHFYLLFPFKMAFDGEPFDRTNYWTTRHFELFRFFFFIRPICIVHTIRSEKFIRLHFNGKLKFLQHYYKNNNHWHRYTYASRVSVRRFTSRSTLSFFFSISFSIYRAATSKSTHSITRD